MIVLCLDCKQHFDDLDRWTTCPHEALPPPLTDEEKARLAEWDRGMGQA